MALTWSNNLFGGVVIHVPFIGLCFITKLSAYTFKLSTKIHVNINLA